MREINEHRVPKRLEVIGMFIKYLVIDYLAIIFALILIVTLWRAIDTI